MLSSNYGKAALRAIELIESSKCSSPVSAWEIACAEIWGDGSSSQSKNCPKSTFLGLCEEGLVEGVPKGIYTLSKKNKSYALEAVKLLLEDETLEFQASKLWSMVQKRYLQHNHQMDVVLALWKHDKIVNGKQQPAEFLLRGSKSTGFRFKLLDCIKDASMNRLSLEYDQPIEAQFHQNLIMIDSWMDKILGEALICFYQEGIDQCQDLMKRLQEKNPLNYVDTYVYEYKFKKFLAVVILGMKADKVWDGNDEAKYKNLVLPGEINIFKHHPYNRSEFEDFVFQHTKFSFLDKDSHQCGEVYEEEGNYYTDLLLQIEFTGE